MAESFGNKGLEPPSGPQSLLEEISPNGNVAALVEADGEVCYFYLSRTGDADFATRSVWVRNLIDAPTALDKERMRDGNPPMNPSGYCRNHAGEPAPKLGEMEVVWLPEGNGAGLYEKGNLLAVIAPWSGQEGFHGFARDCIGDGPVAWEFGQNNALIPRLREAKKFWTAWGDSDPWPDVQSALMGAYEAALGPHSNYYAIDGGRWPPRALIRIPLGDRVAMVTVGVSIRPQPNVELYAEDYETLRRVELGAVLPSDWPDDAMEKFGSYISGQSSLPWNGFTWLGPGHTIPCDAWRNPSFSAALLSYNHPAVPPVALGRQFGDVVRTLWFIPITAEELQKAKDSGSGSVLREIPEDRWREC